MPRKSIGEKAMTDAERQACYRAARATGALAIRTHRPDRSRARRWRDAVGEPMSLQTQYAARLEALPTNLQDSSLADALQAICDLDLAELQAMPSKSAATRRCSTGAKASSSRYTPLAFGDSSGTR
jgi:hypothetical protein